MTDKVTFSNAVSRQLPHLQGMRHERNQARLIASGIGDAKGKPTALAHFLDRLYGPCLEDVEFFWCQSHVFRKIAAGKMIWEAQKRFSGISKPHVCAIGAIIVNGSIHRRKCLDDCKPFYSRTLFWSDLLDEATQLVQMSRKLESVEEGKKNATLAMNGIDADQFRAVRAEWTRMCEVVGEKAGPGSQIDEGVFVDDQVRLRCAILAGLWWVNSFDRWSFLQDVSVWSALYNLKFDIEAYGPNDLVIVGWNQPLSHEDQLWDMPSEGYPLTMVTKKELERHAPDLLEVGEVKKQLAGVPA